MPACLREANGMKLKVSHVTEVTYASIARLAQFNLRLKPAYWSGQELLEYRLDVDPPPAQITHSTGPYIVNNSRIVLANPIKKLRVESYFEVKKTPLVEFDPNDSPNIAALRKLASQNSNLTAYGTSAYLFASPVCKIEAEITRWVEPLLISEQPIVPAAEAVMREIFENFTFDPNATQTNTPPIEAFRKKRGVCQDYAQVMICALRGHGIPAAYVSGYLRTIPPPGQPPLIGADATHAWVNVWCGKDLGWIGFDPTNNIIADMDHIFTAMGRDYSDVAPIDGVYLGPSGQAQKVSVDVSLIG